MQGEWQSRPYTSGASMASVVDWGSCAQPVTLDFPLDHATSGAPVEARAMTDALGFQHCRHAFTVLPSVLGIRLPRFRRLHGHVTKPHEVIVWERHLQVPVFGGDGLDVMYESYVIVGGICHHGDLPTSGHHTSFCCSGHGVRMCDDNRRATWSSTTPAWLLLGLRRDV